MGLFVGLGLKENVGHVMAFEWIHDVDSKRVVNECDLMCERW